MANKRTSYEDYLARGTEHRLRLLMSPQEIPDNVDAPVLWECLVTGKIFDASYHHLGNKAAKNEKASPGQVFWESYAADYQKLAEDYEIDLVYDPMRDLAPADTKVPVKWRDKASGIVFVASYAKLAYGPPNRFMKVKQEAVHGKPPEKDYK